MRKYHLKPFFQRHQWLVNPLGVLILLTSPILCPVLLAWTLWPDVLEGIGCYFEECRELITYKWEE